MACRRRIWTAAMLVATASAVHADGRDDVARCARLGADDARIACLEAALLGDDGRDATTRAAPPDEQVTQAPADAGNGTEARRDATPPPAHEREVRDFGLDAAQLQRDERQSVEVLVTRIDENVYGKMIYTTDDGQVWRQTDQHSPRYAELPFRAEIRSAASGSYFIQPLDGGVAVRVKRWK